MHRSCGGLPRPRARRHRASRARTRPPVRRCRLPRSLTKTILELREASAEPRLYGRNGPAEAVGDVFAGHAVVVGQQHDLPLFRPQAIETRMEPSQLLVPLLVGGWIITARTLQHLRKVLD